MGMEWETEGQEEGKEWGTEGQDEGKEKGLACNEF